LLIQQVDQMQVIVDRCAGLDIHKKSVTACIRTPGTDGDRTEQVRTFPTFLDGLIQLRGWLAAAGVTVVAMEATSSYWLPVWRVLEEAETFELMLVNACHVKHVPGRKTDVADACWLCQLAECGLLRASFVPSPGIRRLRAATRYRKRLVQMRTSEAQRVEKTLEDAVIKLGAVASSTLTKSGRAMIEALIAGEHNPHRLAELAKGRMRPKIPELVRALDGRFDTDHAIQLRQLLDHIDWLDARIAVVDERVVELTRPWAETIQRLCTIPGVGQRTAEVIIAETGADMGRFPTSAHLASWAGLCPGHNESGGKRRSGRTRHGDVWLADALTEAAWAASHTKDTYLAARFWRIAGRKSDAKRQKKAAVAVAHKILVAAYAIMATPGEVYRDLGRDWLDKPEDPQRRTERLVRQLQALGHTVTSQPPDHSGTAQAGGQPASSPCRFQVRSSSFSSQHIYLVGDLRGRLRIRRELLGERA
jgi:transposase